MTGLVPKLAPEVPVNPNDVRRWRRAALSALLLIAVGAVLVIGGVTLWVNAGLEIVTYLTTFALLLWAWWKRLPLPYTWSMIPLLGFGAMVAMQVLLRLSVYPGATLTGWAFLLACGCLFYLGTVAFAESRNVRLAAQVLAWLAVAVAIEALIQRYASPGWIYGFRDATQDAIPIGPFPYHNYFAAFVELTLPVTLVLAWSPGKAMPWWMRAQRLLAPAVVLVAFVEAQSRGGVIALSLEALAGALLCWGAFRRTGRQVPWRRVAIVGSMLSVFCVLAGLSPLFTRFQALSHDVSAPERWNVSLSCLAIWRDHPVWGTGFDTFATVYPLYRRFDNGLTFQRAHNDLLQLLAENGIVGLGLALWFAGSILLSSWRTGLGGLRRGGLSGYYKFAALAGCLGFAVHSTGDFVSHCPANAYMFFVLAAMASTAMTDSPRRATTSRPLHSAVLERMPHGPANFALRAGRRS